MFQKITTSLIAATAVAVLGTAAVADNWRAWNIHHDGHPNTAAMDRFSELVAEKTGGEITVDVFHGGVLGSQPDALEQVRIGAIEDRQLQPRPDRPDGQRSQPRFAALHLQKRPAHVPRSRRRGRRHHGKRNGRCRRSAVGVGRCRGTVFLQPEAHQHAELMSRA